MEVLVGPPCIRLAQKLNRNKVLYTNINKIINNYFVKPRLIWEKKPRIVSKNLDFTMKFCCQPSSFSCAYICEQHSALLDTYNHKQTTI
jgi:hypothetical protein